MNVRFSSRLAWHLPNNPIDDLRRRKVEAGTAILDLTESNPTHAGFRYDREGLLAALHQPAALDYDPQPAGLEPAREAVAAYYAERGMAVDPGRILLTTSTSEAYSYLFQLLADPGDEILVPRPSYPLFEFLAGLQSVRVGGYPLHYDGGWFVDLHALEMAITPRTCAIVLVNPNNPTGSYLKEREREELVKMAAGHGIAILSDEVFADYEFEPDPSRVVSLAAESRALTFSLSGLSKVVGLPQMKLGWIVVSGPPELQAQAWRRLEWIADTYLSVSAPIQWAAAGLLAQRGAIQSQIRQRTAANLARLQAASGDAPWSLWRVEGGWYAILQVPRILSEEEWALELLDRHDVFVQPGFFYDFESEAYLVLSLLTREDVFAEGVSRLAQCIRARCL